MELIPAGNTRLLFVYNADGSVPAMLVDAIHKLVSPRTYQCSLCQLTYGITRQRPAWKAFVAQLPVPVEFLHRDEFRRLFPTDAEDALPAAFVVDGDDEPQLFIPADELNAIGDLDELRTVVAHRVQTLAG